MHAGSAHRHRLARARQYIKPRLDELLLLSVIVPARQRADQVAARRHKSIASVLSLGRQERRGGAVRLILIRLRRKLGVFVANQSHAPVTIAERAPISWRVLVMHQERRIYCCVVE